MNCQWCGQENCQNAACIRRGVATPATGEDLKIYEQIADNFWHDKTIIELRERCAFYERTNAEQAAILNRVIAERDAYRAALEDVVHSRQGCISRAVDALAKYPREDEIEQARRMV